MDKKVILLFSLLVQINTVTFSQTIEKDDTTKLDVQLSSEWQDLIKEYIKEAKLSVNDLVTFEYEHSDDKEIVVLGAIGSRKMFLNKIPSSYSILSDYIILLYFGVEEQIKPPPIYMHELQRVCFKRLEDDLSEPERNPNNPNFKPIPKWATKSYDVEMWRIQLKKRKIVKKEITNTFLYHNK